MIVSSGMCSLLPYGTAICYYTFIYRVLIFDCFYALSFFIFFFNLVFSVMHLYIAFLFLFHCFCPSPFSYFSLT